MGVLNVVILLPNKITTLKDSYINNPFAQLLDEVRNLQISVDKFNAKLSENHQVKPEASPELLTTDKESDKILQSRSSALALKIEKLLRIIIGTEMSLKY